MDVRLKIDPGLCKNCVHARLVVSDRGRAFLLCRAHRIDPDLPKYPPLPVRACRAYQPERDRDPPSDR